MKQKATLYQAKNTREKISTAKKIFLIGAALVGALLIASVLYMTLNKSTRNYAQDEAKPLEAALVKAGAVKKCDRGSDGRGIGNSTPRYKAIYEITGDRSVAARTIQLAAKEANFNLSDNSKEANNNSNKKYIDQTSKQSTYPELESGKILLQATVYGSHMFTEQDNQFCTVTDIRSGAPKDRTLIDLTVNMPTIKHE